MPKGPRGWGRFGRGLCPTRSPSDNPLIPAEAGRSGVKGRFSSTTSAGRRALRRDQGAWRTERPVSGNAPTGRIDPRRMSGRSCVDGSRVARGNVTFLAVWSGAVLCPACLRGHGPLALMVSADEVLLCFAGYHALDLHAGCPRPRSDRFAITSHGPRNF